MSWKAFVIIDIIIAIFIISEMLCSDSEPELF